MSANGFDFKVHFPLDYDAQSEFETPARGYLSGVIVELQDGSQYQVFFYDPVRLGQDLGAEAALGRPYLAEPAMIVLPEVTTTAIRHAIEGLVRSGFFPHLKPMGPRPLATGSAASGN